MGDKIDCEQSLSNLFADEADNDVLLFAEQSMAGSLSLVVAEREPKQERSSSTNSSLQASKSISTLFSKMAWNGSCTSFMGAGDELLHFSSSADDLEGSNDMLALSSKKRGSKRFTPKYKHTPTTLRTKQSPIKFTSNKKTVRKARLKQAPYLQLLVPDENDGDLDTSISVAGVLTISDEKDRDLDASISVADMLNSDSVLPTEVTPRKIQDQNDQDSSLSESKRKPKRAFSRKESCLFESGRNKLRRTTRSTRNLFNSDKEDVAPKCPRRCESPTNETCSLRVRVNDNL